MQSKKATQRPARRDFIRTMGLGAGAVSFGANRLFAAEAPATPPKPPNILWIIGEDMSLNMSCYGETVIETPNIDRLAREGALFKRAFVCAPVCSPSRSAVITGMYQTTIGAHNHRSSRHVTQIALPEPVKLLPEIFQAAGYLTVNAAGIAGAAKRPKAKKQIGKTDYNFAWDSNVYDAGDWSGRKSGQPFFAQIQLRGGKFRNAKAPNPVDPAHVKIPPYYPDHPVLRQDWAQYLNSVINIDGEVGAILKRLEDEGIAEETVVVFLTDHGISHARDKQFLYEGGMRIPLIIRWPGRIEPGTVREDLVSHIDIAATSLDLAGLTVPEYMESRPLFGPKAHPREYVVGARDRCDETVECIRCVRTERFKYIRNFRSDRSHLQPNRYKDGKKIVVTMRRLHAEGKLDAVQERLFAPTRPTEELYDLANDPNELRNLADTAEHANTRARLRETLYQWMEDTRDPALIPEPMLVDYAQQHGNIHAALRRPENRDLPTRLRAVVELMEQGEPAMRQLIAALNDERPAVRYWAAFGLGNLGKTAVSAAENLKKASRDSHGAVRVAAARALCRMGVEDQGLAVLEKELTHDNEIVRHYAALALEDLGDEARPALDALKAATKDKYEYVRRVSTRVVDNLENAAAGG